MKPTETVWGEVEIRAADPKVRTFQDVLYVDWKHDARWGLFESDETPIEAAIDRLPTGEAIHQVPEVPPRARMRELETLDEELLYIGKFNPHYGHFLVESLPRFWMLSNGMSLQRRLLFHSNAHKDFFPHHPFARAIFGALGLSEDSFVASSVSMKVRSVIVPEPSYRSQVYGHPAYRRLCKGIGDRLLADHDLRRNDRPVWLSKSALRGGVARVSNEWLVEQALERAGVEILRPELMSFTEQLRIFATRSVVMGTTGSALHSIIFTPPPERLILIDQTDFKNSNFEMFDRLSGARSEHYFPTGSGDVAPDDFLNQRAFPEPERVAKAILDLL